MILINVIINICAFQLFHVKTDAVKKLSPMLHRTETASFSSSTDTLLLELSYYHELKGLFYW